MSRAAAGEAGVVAVLTAPGRGGIAVLRAAGPGAAAAVAACFRRAGQRPASLPETGRLAYGHVVDPGGDPLDEVILYRAGGAAFEVNCHGGPAAVEAVAGRLAGGGLRRVSPDALRAYEGAGPVARAARRALQDATMPPATRVLLDQLDGALGRAVAEVRAALAAGRSAQADARLGTLVARYERFGRFLARPPRVAVAGRPNAGKSTLVNRLAGADRVLTDSAPGTTRDAVEVEASLGGLPVVLIDTAGLREALDPVEREGTRRAEAQAAGADAVLYLLDAAAGATDADREALAALGARAIAVWNKADAARAVPDAPAGLSASALTGAGVEAVVAAVLERLGVHVPAPGAAVPFTEAQAAALAAARGAHASGDADAARAALDALGA